MKTKTVAIVGRPNVGKSTLVNRIVGERKSIVDDTALQGTEFILMRYGNLNPLF